MTRARANVYVARKFININSMHGTFTQACAGAACFLLWASALRYLEVTPQKERKKPRASSPHDTKTSHPTHSSPLPQPTTKPPNHTAALPQTLRARPRRQRGRRAARPVPRGLRAALRRVLPPGHGLLRAGHRHLRHLLAGLWVVLFGVRCSVELFCVCPPTTDDEARGFGPPNYPRLMYTHVYTTHTPRRAP